jgi:hypothetical protein
MTAKSIWPVVSLNSEVSLVEFYLYDLSIGEGGVLKPPPIILLESICFYVQ